MKFFWIPLILSVRLVVVQLVMTICSFDSRKSSLFLKSEQNQKQNMRTQYSNGEIVLQPGHQQGLQ